MARKSRKETAAVVVQEADAACRAAIYVRLSVEDTHTHSVSIETQQMIIARYLEQYPEISVYDTYIDNGATGTNFHRPGFQQMLSDIEAGHVNCVIVKDLSRLGRNTIDTGYYIEQYFRIRSVRFIAVNENFDTAAPEDAHSGIIIPLRNMINEAYALDIGRKIRAQQRQAMKDGKFIGARTPYGYLKAEDTTKNHNHTPFACHCDKVGGPLFFCFIHIILSVVHRAWWSSGGRAAYSWGSCW